MADPCPTCLPIICEPADDTALYTLESSLFPFVFFCPSGYDCNADSFSMVCCGNLLSVDFPPNATVDDKEILRQGIVNQCAAILPSCGGQCQGAVCALFYNRTVLCSTQCADGSTFTYTVTAGTFAAQSQADADSQAQSYACQQAPLRRVCMGNLPGCLCYGVAYSATIGVSGGLSPYVFSVTDGALPTGLSLSSGGVLSGTPSASGSFTFQITVTSGGGGQVVKSFTMTVLHITTAALPPYTVGQAYSFQMVVVGGSGHYLWKVVSGSLPAGLTMNSTGLISGTPQ